MKDIRVIHYNEISPAIASQGTSYECEIEINDELIYGQQGLNLLIQLVLTELLKTPGRDVISPRDGGGLLELRGVMPSDTADAEVRVVRSISAVEEQILARQMGESFPANETLKSLKCGEGIYYDTVNNTWIIPIKLEALSGDTRLFDIPLAANA